LCGLGASNHTVLGVYAIAFSLFVVITDPGILLRPKEILVAGLSAALGLLPYLYLPIRSRMDPALDWGDPENLNRFLDVVLRRNFWVRAWVESPADLLTIAADFLGSLVDQFTLVGVGFVALGLGIGWRRGWPVWLMLLVTVANVGVMALHGSRTDIFVWHRYYIASYVMMALLAGVACNALLERLPRPARWLPLVLPIFLLANGWQSFDRSRYRIAEEFSLAVLRSLPPGASLIATDDNILFVLIYLSMVERERPDVNLILQGVGEADLPPLRFNPDTEPLFFTHHPNWSLPALDIVPVGLVFQAWRSDRPPPEPNITLWELPGENDPSVPKDYLTQNLIGHLHYMLGFTFERRDWLRAQKEFDSAAAASPHNDVLFYNLGLIYQRNGLFDQAIGAFEQAQQINPRHLASQSRPRAADRIIELRAERNRIERIERTLSGEDELLRNAKPGTLAYHARMAELLAAAGEVAASRGHRLRAEAAVGRASS
jgi:tetratricopeptide (TPR) repeat protein